MLQALSGLNLQKLVGQQLKVSKAFDCFQEVLTLEEVKRVKDFLAANRYEDDSAFLEHKEDLIDMDDLISAVKT